MLKLLINISICFLISSSPAFSQFDILKKAKEKAEEKIEKEIDKTLEGEEEENQSTEEQKGEEQQSESVEQEEEKSELKSYSKYDFVPGENVIFYDDFSTTEAGDFPANWNTTVSGEVVTLNNYPGKWFKLVDACGYEPLDLPQFPDNVTIEFDLIFNAADELAFGVLYAGIFSKSDNYALDGDAIGNSGGEFRIQADFTEAYNWKDQSWGNVSTSKNMDLRKYYGRITKISVWRQKERIRLYINEEKVFDLPKFIPPGYDYDALRFYSYVHDNSQIYVSNIRIAVGAPDTRNKLITEGRLVTHGIYFDSGSEIVKPESYGTLKEIATVLKENPDVKVKIVGHTDSDGADDKNLDLSKRRAASVKNFLIKEFGIEASKMETDGRGEAEPISDNNTNEGKANNRRVEFIKL